MRRRKRRFTENRHKMKKLEFSIKPIDNVIIRQRLVSKIGVTLVDFLQRYDIIQNVEREAGFWDMDFREVILFITAETVPISKSELYDETELFVQREWPEFELRNVFIHDDPYA